MIGTYEKEPSEPWDFLVNKYEKAFPELIILLDRRCINANEIMEKIDYYYRHLIIINRINNFEELSSDWFQTTHIYISDH